MFAQDRWHSLYTHNGSTTRFRTLLRGGCCTRVTRRWQINRSLHSLFLWLQRLSSSLVTKYSMTFSVSPMYTQAVVVCSTSFYISNWPATSMVTWLDTFSHWGGENLSDSKVYPVEQIWRPDTLDSSHAVQERRECHQDEKGRHCLEIGKFTTIHIFINLFEWWRWTFWKRFRKRLPLILFIIVDCQSF